MYNRLDRKKNPPDISYVNEGGIMDLFDDALKGVFIITDEEYDTLAENLDDSICALLTREKLSYSEAKKLLLAIKSIL